tara:strand:- start:995 stop:1243 length:249 start_codon:yes stop_codon:yes gene_type:complete
MENWHLSRNVPIALFLALVVQAVSVSGAFTKVEVGVEQNSKDIVAVGERVSVLDNRQREHEVRLARMDENIIHIRELLESQQ